MVSKAKRNSQEAEVEEGSWRTKRSKRDKKASDSWKSSPKVTRSSKKAELSEDDRPKKTKLKEEEEGYNPFDKECPKSYTRAIDCIYGMPFGGSVVFAGVKGSADLCETVINPAGLGEAKVKMEVNDNLAFEATSAGFLDGDFAEILINGVDYSPNKRGINLVVVDPENLDAYLGVFDTHSHENNESVLLARFIESIPDGHYVIISVRYDCSKRLHVTAREALKNLGLAVPLDDDSELLSSFLEDLDREKAGDLLTFCAQVNAKNCAFVLLENGWKVDHVKKHGSLNTAIHDAVFHGSVDVLKVLLKYDPDRSLLNKWKETAEDIASKLFGFTTLEDMIADPEVVDDEVKEKTFDFEIVS